MYSKDCSLYFTSQSRTHIHAHKYVIKSKITLVVRDITKIEKTDATELLHSIYCISHHKFREMEM